MPSHRASDAPVSATQKLMPHFACGCIDLTPSIKPRMTPRMIGQLGLLKSRALVPAQHEEPAGPELPYLAAEPQPQAHVVGGAHGLVVSEDHAAHHGPDVIQLVDDVRGGRNGGAVGRGSTQARIIHEAPERTHPA